MARVWRLAPAGAFESRFWDAQAVVYVHATGDTHALSDDASALLSLIMRSEGRSESSQGWLRELLAPEGDADDAADGTVAPGDLAGFEQLLDSLSAVGLLMSAEVS